MAAHPPVHVLDECGLQSRAEAQATTAGPDPAQSSMAAHQKAYNLEQRQDSMVQSPESPGPSLLDGCSRLVVS